MPRPLARRALLVLFTWLLAAVGGCKPSPEARPEAQRQAMPRAPAKQAEPAPSAAFEPGDAERGKQLVASFQCNRCHQGTGLAAPALEQDCVACHQQIASGKFRAAPDKLAKWAPHVSPYRDVPSLTALGARLRPAWVMRYLLEPHDLRPNLAPTMPRLKLTPQQARDIATYLTRGAPAPAPPLTADAAQIEHGKQLMSERGCVGCHHMTGSGLTAPPKTATASGALGLAPDLRFARERSEPGAILSWLLDPKQVKADAVMPRLELSPADARDLAAFVSYGELLAPPAPAAFERLPVLSRRVGFDEVNERVFAVTCRHCHTNPDLADGDGGPGNTGGFGFAARKIDFSSYKGILSGALVEGGARVSLFEHTSEGVPRLVAALLARTREERGAGGGEVRGMPLGLPALSAEQIQLVESWVAQGRPL